MRSPSCPRLSTLVTSGHEMGRLGSPLSGMVASRKKVFEGSPQRGASDAAGADAPARLSLAQK